MDAAGSKIREHVGSYMPIDLSHRSAQEQRLPRQQTPEGCRMRTQAGRLGFWTGRCRDLYERRYFD